MSLTTVDSPGPTNDTKEVTLEKFLAGLSFLICGGMIASSLCAMCVYHTIPFVGFIVSTIVGLLGAYLAERASSWSPLGHGIMILAAGGIGGALAAGSELCLITGILVIHAIPIIAMVSALFFFLPSLMETKHGGSVFAILLTIGAMYGNPATLYGVSTGPIDYLLTGGLSVHALMFMRRAASIGPRTVSGMINAAITFFFSKVKLNLSEGFTIQMQSTTHIMSR